MKELCTNSQHGLGDCLCPLGWHSAKSESPGFANGQFALIKLEKAGMKTQHVSV